MKWHNSLRFQLPMLFVLLLIALLFAIQNTIDHVVAPSLEKQMHDLMEQTGESIILNIQSRISQAEALTTALARAGEALPKDVAEHERVIRQIIDYPGTESYIAGGGIWPEPFAFDEKVERRSFFWGRNAEGVLEYYDDYNDLQGNGYHHEEWYVPARTLHPGEAYWSRSYSDPYSGQPMVTCTVPMYRDNRLYGVTTIDLKLEGLTELLAEKSSLLNGYVFIVDRFGRFISYPDEGLSKTVVTNEKGEELTEVLDYRALAAKDSRFSEIAEQIAQVQLDILSKAKQKTLFDQDIAHNLAEQSYQIDAAEGEILAATLSDPLADVSKASLLLSRFSVREDLLLGKPSQVDIFHVPGAYWKVVTVVPTEHVLGTLESVRKTVFITTIVVIGVMLAISFAFLLRILIQPLKGITDRLRNEGDKETLFESPVRSNNELGLMAYWLARRSAQLANAKHELLDHRDHLQEMVELKTKDLQLAKDESDRANRAKSEFLASMSHELRTPLNAIMGFSQLFELDPDLNRQQKQNATHIYEAGKHLLSLVNQVLDLSKIETGNMEVSLGRVEVSDLIRECQTLIVPQVKSKSIVLEVGDIPPRLAVRADYTRLKQVLLNLLSNAVKYNKAGGKVILSCTDGDNGRLRITVSDTGRGIDASRLEELFQPFNRLGAEGSNIEGAGIGLVITRQLMELMGGTLGVDSVVGEGSRFWVELPLYSGAAPAGAWEKIEQQRTSTATGQAYKVLYVEDNPANMKLVENMFAPHKDCTLLSAATAEQGLAVAMADSPDLILMDINLPGMDGYDALALLRKTPATESIPVIAISANAMPDDLQRAEAAGFDEYITKPVDADRLLATVFSILFQK
jgi:signal transduction histidine kinase/CheY-like chemotaxis protein